LADEEARTRRLLEERSDPSRGTALTPTVPEAPDEATVFALPVPAQPGSASPTPAVIEPSTLVEVTEPQRKELTLPTAVPTVAPGTPESVGRAAFGRLGTRGRPLALTAGGLVVVAIAIFWVMTSLVASRRLRARSSRQARHDGPRAAEGRANHLAAGGDDAAARSATPNDGKAGRLSAAVEMLREATARLTRRDGPRGRVEQRAKPISPLDMLERAAAEMRSSRKASRARRAMASIASLRSGGGRGFRSPPPARRGATTARVPGPSPPATPPARDATHHGDSRNAEFYRGSSRQDLALLQRIRPSIRPEELSRYRDVFDRTKSYKLNLKVEAVKVNGDEAEARGRREDVVVTSDGETVKTPGDFRFQFKRSNNRWTIEAIR
jgi:hypothetical protein